MLETTITRPVHRVIRTGVAEESSLASGDDEREIQVKKWAAVIASTLVEWEIDPNLLIDEGIDPPSTETIESARRFAVDASRCRNLSAPTRICTTGDGGIAFEWESGETLEIIRFESDASVFHLTYHQNLLESKRRVR